MSRAQKTAVRIAKKGQCMAAVRISSAYKPNILIAFQIHSTDSILKSFVNHGSAESILSACLQHTYIVHQTST